jgi:hypothetical protein
MIGSRSTVGAGSFDVSGYAPRQRQLREAVLRICCDPLAADAARLLDLSDREWRGLLRWMDTSGLALYFLDQVVRLDLAKLLPVWLVARLQQNLRDNSERIEAMAAELEDIQRRFQETGLCYAVLKGFSLWPISVPNPHLRSQLDHDFLIAEEDAEEAKGILESFGYRLMVKSGSSWEFKAPGGVPSLKTLYKPGMSRQAELHLASSGTDGAALLAGRRFTSFRDISMPVLSPADAFIGQGLHVFKHVCSAFSRTAHLVEFHRHLVARRTDQVFWEEIRRKCAGRPDIGLRLGVVILLASVTIGPFAPPELSECMVDQLPAPVMLWITLYGSRTLLASFPGSKLYLFLERELEVAGFPRKRTLGRSLVPRSLPPLVDPAAAGETHWGRLARRWRRLRFLWHRLCFHALEGIRYACESVRWRRTRRRLTL